MCRTDQVQIEWWRRYRRLIIVSCALLGAFFVGATIEVAAQGIGITSPTEGQRVYGTIPVRGIVDAPDFAAWQMDVLVNGDAHTPAQLAKSQKRVSQDSVLVRLDTLTLTDGPQTLRLRVIKTNGQYDEYFVRFVVDNANVPPTPSKPVANQPASVNRIEYPPDGAVISGTVIISGTADSPDFLSWKLDILFDGKPERALTIAAARSRHLNDAPMTQLNTTLFADGEHVLRLRVSKKDGTFTESSSRLVIANKNSAAVDSESHCAEGDSPILPVLAHNSLLSFFQNYFRYFPASCADSETG